jgi:phage I-like protein
MSDELVIVPSGDGDNFVPLARTKTGRLFRKHLLNLGNLRHPTTGKNIAVDEKFAAKLQENFKAGYCDIVQVPLANDKNEHTEDPTRNIGEVVDIEVADKKVYAILDVRDEKHADKLGKTLLGASAMMHLDYTDTTTGKKVGPTLLHACVTNRPYVTGLEDYKEIVNATSDSSEGAVMLTTDDADDVVEVESPSTEENDMTDAPKTVETPVKPSLEEMLTALKNDHNIDVEALRAQAAEKDAAAALSKTLVDALTNAGVVKHANTENSDSVSTDDVVAGIADLAKDNVALTNRVQALEKENAENEIDALIKSGHIIPAKKAQYIELRLTNPSMFAALLPEEPLIKLNNEQGAGKDDDKAHKLDVDAEITRLTAMWNDTATTK